MESHPIVSVIIPTYNYARFIGEAIDSILTSNFPIDEVEIIVIDDGSTDDTAEKVKVYEDKVKYIAQENLGKAWATKVGIDNAKGRYIFNLDADDLFLPNKIREVVDIFEADKDIVHVAHPALCWNVEQDTKGVEPVPEDILGKKMLGKDLLSYFYKKGILFGGGSTFAARAEVLKSVNLPKEVDMFIDEYLVLVTLNQGYSLLLEKPLSIWRIHKKNYSNSSAIAHIDKTKIRRSVYSLDAIYTNLSNVGLEESIKNLYELRNKVLALYLKEKSGEKSFIDILSMWRCVFNTFRLFGKDAFGIVRNYPILMRTLPNSLLALLKDVFKK